MCQIRRALPLPRKLTKNSYFTPAFASPFVRPKTPHFTHPFASPIVCTSPRILRLRSLARSSARPPAFYTSVRQPGRLQTPPHLTHQFPSRSSAQNPAFDASVRQPVRLHKPAQVCTARLSVRPLVPPKLMQGRKYKRTNIFSNRRYHYQKI